MTNLNLIKYRIKHNDTELILKVRILRFLVIIVILIPLLCFLKPLTWLSEYLRPNDNVDKTMHLSFGKNVTPVYVPTDKLPIDGTVTSGYGYRNDPISGTYSKHTGIDISGIHHIDIKAFDAGIVTFAGSQNGYGNCVEIKHDKYYTFYAHLSAISVKEGQSISKGDKIGVEGGDPYTDPNPGNSTGHHLHFEIRTDSGYGNDIDPSKYYTNQSF